MDYDASLAQLKGLEKLGIRFRVENTRELLGKLGYDFAAETVHIAGTNGKGSCAATLAKILQEDGKKAGLYTSPELVDFRERIMVDGKPIPEDAFARIATALKPIIDSMPEQPTFFEATTALALKHFADEKVDVMVLEAGMGGRLDSTNAVPSKLSIITNVDLDHMSYLGGTVEEIAREKAGIVGEGTTLITAADDGALMVLRQECKAKGAKMILAGPEVIRYPSTSLEGTSFKLKGRKASYQLTSPLRGLHQADNVSCAVLAAEELGASEGAILSGVSKTHWPGRLDLVQKEPMVLLDCAHNPAGIARTMEFVKAVPHERLIVVAGFSKDKDYRSMIRTLSSADLFIAAEYANPRSLKASEILSEIKGESAPSVREAVKAAISKAAPKDLVLVTGSIYVVGEAIQLWKAETSL